jgi:hypothetical protein
MTTSSAKGRRPVPDTMRQDAWNASATYRWWTKSREFKTEAGKEVRRLDDNAVIQFVRRGLRREAQGVSEERKAFIAGIIRRLKDEDIWPAFAKTCRHEHGLWLAWCMKLNGDDDGDDEAGDDEAGDS